MPHARRALFQVASVATLGLCIVAAGCRQDSDSTDDRKQAADTYPTSPTGLGGGTSHLGAAVQSARDVTDRINQRRHDMDGDE